jgi:ATP-dependent protease HslVU (ClpYQ) peptidase subunit
VSDGAGGVKLEWSIDTSNNLDQAYDAFGGPGTVNIDNGSLTWALDGSYDFIIDVDNAAIAKGFKVKATANNQQLSVYYTPSSSKLKFEFYGDDFKSLTPNGQATFEGDYFYVDSQVGFFLYSQGISQILAQGVNADLFLGGRGESLSFNQSGNTTLSGFAGGTTSIIAAFNELKAGNLTNLFVGNGSVTAPSISFASDTNTGLYLKASDTLAVTTGGVERLSVAAAGNVLVGTGTPAVATGAGDLYVTGDLESAVNTAVLGQLSVGKNTADSGFRLHVYEASTNSRVKIETANAASYAIQSFKTPSYDVEFNLNDSTGDFQLYSQTAGASRFSVSSAGAFKVGTGTPSVATGAGDLYVTRYLEVDDIFYSDGGVTVASDKLLDSGVGALSGSIKLLSPAQTPGTSLLMTGTAANSWIVCERADAGYDFSHSLQQDPTLFIHSRNQSIAEWVGYYHDGTYGRVNTGTGAYCVGTGTPAVATGTGDLYVTGKGEFDDLLYADSGVRTTSAVYGSGNDFSVGAADFTNYGFIRWSSAAQTPNTNLICTGTVSNAYVLCEYADRSFDFAHALQTPPTLFIQSQNQVIDEYATLAWNNLSIGGSKGSFAGLKSITEELTIAVGQGAAGVTTSGNLAPANADIRSTVVRVTQAPGGGATTFDVSVTGSANPDELIDALSTALNTTGTSQANNDGTQLPIQNGSATTLTVTTDANVTTSDMKVRIVTFYENFTPPTA